MATANLAPLPAEFATTVASLHRVAEEILAPARKPDNEISLRATPGGFGTPEFVHGGVRQRVRVEGDELVREARGEARRTRLTSLAVAAELVADLLPAAPGDEPLAVDREASLALGSVYELGAAVLGQLADEAADDDEPTQPRLWPEHFDIAIELGSEADGVRANYGVSPGDDDHPEPYLYVGPWTAEVSGELWRASGFKGAELSYSELLAAGGSREEAASFFRTRTDALKERRSR
ncbi:MAG: hypothetical protein ACM3NV_02040 [Syntrophothermus sp.]